MHLLHGLSIELGSSRPQQLTARVAHRECGKIYRLCRAVVHVLPESVKRSGRPHHIGCDEESRHRIGAAADAPKADADYIV